MAQLNKVIVIGGAGFIGAEVVRQFAAISGHIVVIDNFRTGYRDREELRYAEVLEQDIRHGGGDWVRALRHADLVIHLAANQDIPWSVSNMLEDFEINVLGTRNVVHACIAAGVPKLLYSASSAMYGRLPEGRLPITEEGYPQPAVTYGKAKLQGELEVLAGSRTYGYDAHSLRIYSTYGSRESHANMDEVRLFTLGLHRGRDVPVQGDPAEQARDYVHVSDVARAFVLAAQDAKKGDYYYNVCSGRMTAFSELLDIIESELGRRPGVAVDPAGQPGKEWGSYHKARSLIGYEPQADLAWGVRQMWEWVVSAPEEMLKVYRVP